MTLPLDSHEMARAMLDARAEIDTAFDQYRKAIQEDADADRASKLAQATAYATAKAAEGKPTVPEIEAKVNQTTADVQHRARLAEGMKKAAHLNVQHRMAVLSSLQSLASLTKAEAQISAYEPREVA